MVAYPFYKNSGISWLGELPEYWGIKPLRAIFKIRNEKNDPVKTDQILSLSIAHGVTLYSDKGRGGNKAKDDLTAYKIAYPNDIVLNSMNVIVGAVGLSKYLGAISPVYYAIYLRPENDNVLSYYDKIFSNATFQRYLSIYGKGILIKKSDSGKLNTIRMKISMEDLKNIALPIPPVDEQIKIAKYLDWKTAKINKFIKAKKKLIALLKEQKQKIINEAVTKGIKPNVEMKDSGIDWIGKIPSHWNTIKFKYISKFYSGGTPTKNNEKYWNGDIPWISPKDMKKKYITESSDYITEEAIKNSSTGTVNNNDILMVVRSGILRRTIPIGIVKNRVTFNQDIRAVILKKDIISPHFLYNIVVGCEKKLLNLWLKVGATVESIEYEYMANTYMPLPPKDEQLEITNHIDNETSLVDETIKQAEHEIELIQEYHNRLISDVVTGKVDVRSIQIPYFETIEADINISENESTTEELVMENIEK